MGCSWPVVTAARLEPALCCLATPLSALTILALLSGAGSGPFGALKPLSPDGSGTDGYVVSMPYRVDGVLGDASNPPPWASQIACKIFYVDLPGNAGPVREARTVPVPVYSRSTALVFGSTVLKKSSRICQSACRNGLKSPG